MSDVVITVKAVDDTKKGLGDSQRRIEEWSRQAQQAAKSYAAVERQKQQALEATAQAEKRAWQNTIAGLAKVSAAFAAAYLAAKKFYSFAREGAQIEFTRIKFDRLAATIGTTGDALLEKLRPATRGTMSDMQMIASATDILSLGLIKNERDAVRLTKVMAGLGMDINQVALALSNQTTMRFDQLGVSVNGFDERLKALKKSGMDVQSAFTEAFLQQAEEQLAKVGHAADTAAGQFMQAEAEWSNFVDSLKLGAKEAVLPLVSAWNEAHSAVKLHTAALEETQKLFGVTFDQVARGGQAFQSYTAQLERGAAATEYYNNIITNFPSAFSTVSSVVAEATMTQEQFNEQMKNLAQLMDDDLSQAQDSYIEKISELQEKLKTAKESQKSDIVAQIEAETKAYNERATAIMFNIQQQAILEAAKAGKIDYSQASQAIAALAENYGLIDENQRKVMEGTQMLIDQFAETGNLDNFTSGLQLMRDAQLELAPTIDSSTDSAKNFEQQLDRVLKFLKALPPSGSTWNYSFEAVMHGVSGGGGGSGGFGNVTANAGGGAMGDIAIVGDAPGGGWTPYTEVVAGGYVYSNKQARAMRDAGLLNGAKHMAGGGWVAPLPMDDSPTLMVGVGFGTEYAKRKNNSNAPAGVVTTASASAPLGGIGAGITQEVNAQLQGVMLAANQMTQATTTTNKLLEMLIAKTASETGIAKAVVGQGSKYS